MLRKSLAFARAFARRAGFFRHCVHACRTHCSSSGGRISAGFTTTAMTRSPSERSSGTTSAGSRPKSLAPSRSRSSTPSPPWFATPTPWDAKEAYDYLKQFVLEQMRVPDLPHHPMNDLRNITPPPLPPAPDRLQLSQSAGGRRHRQIPPQA
jgi:hypothetical protein